MPRHFGGATSGGVFFQPDLSGMAAKLSRLQGKFQSGQVEMHAAFERMAQHVQQEQVKILVDRIKAHGRPQVERPHGANALVRIWGSSGNRIANADGFAVGIEEFLDSSAVAPYYRFIEEGTDIFVGRVLRGAFRTLEGSFVAPNAKRYPRDPRLIQLVTGQYKTGGAIRQFQGKDAQGQVQRETQRAANQRRRREVKALLTKGKLPGWRIVIRNPIPAYQFAEEGASVWLRSGDAQREFKTALASFEAFLEFRDANGLTSRQARAALR
jgi:hypothetical protein